MNASKKNTQAEPRAKWFWAGPGTDQRTGETVMRWAKGTSHGQQNAQRFVMVHIEHLRRCDPHLFGYDLSMLTACEEKGTLPSSSGLDIYNRACRELTDDCPWLVPVPMGWGLLYVVGAEPDFEELEVIRTNAGLR